MPPLLIGSVPPPREAVSPMPGYARETFGARESGQRQFDLAQDERVLKTYEAVELRTGLFKRKRGQGALYITDARVVFCAWMYRQGTQRESLIFQQTRLEDISGVEAFVTRRVSLGLLVLTVVCGLVAIGNLVSFNLALFLLFAILTALFGALLMRSSARRGSVGVTLFSRDDGHSPISFGRRPRLGVADRIVRMLMWPILIFFPAYNAWDVVDGDPAEDADQLLRELGALILDLQTHGSLAYPHWGIIPVGEAPAAEVAGGTGTAWGTAR